MHLLFVKCHLLAFSLPKAFFDQKRLFELLLENLSHLGMWDVVTFNNIRLFWEGLKRCPLLIEPLLFEGAHAALAFSDKVSLSHVH